jgi:hypothetical protein
MNVSDWNVPSTVNLSVVDKVKNPKDKCCANMEEDSDGMCTEFK